MFNFNAYNLLAGIVFGIIGMGSLSYGRKLERWQPQAIGLALMTYPYFISNGWLVWLVGAALVLILWYHHDE